MTAWDPLARWLRWVIAAVGQALSAVLVLGIVAYQRYISPAFGPTCRYHPSCSTYALGAVRQHGPVKGTLLAVGRLARCNPWSRGGIDHVPEKGSWRGGKEIRPSDERVGS